MAKNEVFDLIITLLKSIKNKTNIEYRNNGKEYKIYSTDNYLQNQVLRRYYQGEDKVLISKKAKEMWLNLFDENKTENRKGENVFKNIKNFTYNDKITLDKDYQGRIDKYSGSKKEPVGEYKFDRGKDGKKRIQYNDVFHDEHIIPIKMIIEELKKINNPEFNDKTYNEVEKILDKIYICKMLKSEDRSLLDARKRKSTDVIEVIEENYWKRTNNKTRIEIDDWENIKNKIIKNRNAGK